MSVKFNSALVHSTLLSSYENPIAYDPNHLLPVGYWVCLKCGHDFYGAGAFTLHKGDISTVGEDNNIQVVAKCILSRMHPDAERGKVNIENGFKSKHLIFVMGPNLDPGMYLDSYPFPRNEILTLRDIAKKNFELSSFDRAAVEISNQQNTWID